MDIFVLERGGRDGYWHPRPSKRRTYRATGTEGEATGHSARNRCRDHEGLHERLRSAARATRSCILHINNPRWAGVPFVIKAGKALDERKVEVRIRFNAVAGAVKSVSRCAPNELIVRVQPDESIYWKVQSKAPGLDFHIEQQRMDLLYSSKFFERKLPEAYERLLLEVLPAFERGMFSITLKRGRLNRLEDRLVINGARSSPAALQVLHEFGLCIFEQVLYGSSSIWLVGKCLKGSG